MINRDMQQMSVVTYVSGIDEYGQLRQKGSTSRNIEGVFKIQSQVNVNDPRYIDCDAIVITKDFQIDTSNKILFNNDYYSIKHTIPTNKYLQVILKKDN